MKIRSKGTGGSILLTVVVTSTVLGISLAAYLTLVSHQNRSVMRSLSWNSALPIIEAGLEEALTHLYWNYTNTLARDGWSRQSGLQLTGTNLSGTFFAKRRDLPEGYCVVGISDTMPPAVYAEGFTKLPLSDSYISRSVRLNTRRDGMFAKGMVAKGKIDLNGQNVSSDSYDSIDPFKSTAGQYDPAKAGDMGDVASNSGIVGIFNVGNANIYGRAATGPGGTIVIGPNGGVGSHVWQASHKGIQPGWSSDDMNLQFPDVKDPFTAGYSTPGGNPLAITSSGNWLLSSLNKTLVVKSNVQAVLKVTGSISITGNDKVVIEPGASLQLYMAGATAKIAGNGVINQPGNATNFIYYGMPANTSLDFSGNGSFIGAIYAPNANFTLGGGGSTITDFCGASVTASVKMNGHFRFHYDENLGRVGPLRGFVVTAWNEI